MACEQKGHVLYSNKSSKKQELYISFFSFFSATGMQAVAKSLVTAAKQDGGRKFLPPDHQ